jgi:hypothetical protein
MALQTSNLLLLIRCFTKYIIEIENESALMEQLNVKSPKSVTDGKNFISLIFVCIYIKLNFYNFNNS